MEIPKSERVLNLSCFRQLQQFVTLVLKYFWGIIASSQVLREYREENIMPLYERVALLHCLIFIYISFKHLLNCQDLPPDKFQQSLHLYVLPPELGGGSQKNWMSTWQVLLRLINCFQVGCDAGNRFQDVHKCISVFRYTIWVQIVCQRCNTKEVRIFHN